MSPSSVPKSHIMLVEDEALIAVALQADLEEAGYTVAGPFTTCERALTWLEGNRPDVAVLDTVLKDGPCKDVALKLNQQGVPFIVYSGYAENRNILPAPEDVTWVEKPATAEALLNAVAGLKSRVPAPV